MPTIDQLAPATAASDNDELLVSQSGIARKVTRAQVLAGVQPQLAISSGTLLGRTSGGTGGPEQISIGANLTLTNGALSASATPFNVASLTAGTVPASSDLVPLGQGGGNAAVTYSQFMSGLAGISNVDVSQLLVTPTGGNGADQTWRSRREHPAIDRWHADRRTDPGRRSRHVAAGGDEEIRGCADRDGASRRRVALCRAP